MSALTPDIETYVQESITNATTGPYADINAAFTLNSGYLVFFMHCGFAMVRLLLIWTPAPVTD